jgi:hypothetical protein
MRFCAVLVGVVALLTACSSSLVGDYHGAGYGAIHHLTVNPDGSFRDAVNGEPFGTFTLYGYWRRDGWWAAVLVADSDVSSRTDGRIIPTERATLGDTAAWWQPRRFEKQGGAYLLSQPYGVQTIRLVKDGG